MMKLIDEIQLYKKMPEVLNDVSDNHERVIVAHDDNKTAVILSMDDYNDLLQKAYQGENRD